MKSSNEMKQSGRESFHVMGCTVSMNRGRLIRGTDTLIHPQHAIHAFPLPIPTEPLESSLCCQADGLARAHRTRADQGIPGVMRLAKSEGAGGHWVLRPGGAVKCQVSSQEPTLDFRLACFARNASNIRSRKPYNLSVL